MVRHVARLSGATAASRDRIAKTLRTLPEVAAAFRDGTIGTDQMALLGRVHANRRVRDFMVDAQEWFLRHARRMSYRDFEIAVREWERLADEDGAEPNERMHQARRVRLTQDEQALTWELDGRMGAAMGAAIDEIFQHYLSAERLADWEKAKAEYGELAHEGDLRRSEAQRSADALWQVFQDAAAADGSCVPADFTHNIVWTATAYEEMLRRLDGEAPRPIDPDEFRCETGNGVPPARDRRRGRDGDRPGEGPHLHRIGPFGRPHPVDPLPLARMPRSRRPMRDRSQRRTRPRRENQPRQRGTGLRQAQPTQAERLPGVA